MLTTHIRCSSLRTSIFRRDIPVYIVSGGHAQHCLNGRSGHVTHAQLWRLLTNIQLRGAQVFGGARAFGRAWKVYERCDGLPNLQVLRDSIIGPWSLSGTRSATQESQFLGRPDAVALDSRIARNLSVFDTAGVTHGIQAGLGDFRL